MSNFLFLADLYKIPRKNIKEKIDFLIDSLRLETVVKKRVEHLSGGMQKRVNLAGSLVHSPSLLLLDEPTANLDLETKSYVHNLLKELILKNNIQIVCSSHDLTEISQSATHLLIIRQGKQRYFSKIENISATSGSELKIQRSLYTFCYESYRMNLVSISIFKRGLLQMLRNRFSLLLTILTTPFSYFCIGSYLLVHTLFVSECF